MMIFFYELEKLISIFYTTVPWWQLNSTTVCQCCSVIKLLPHFLRTKTWRLTEDRITALLPQMLYYLQGLHNKKSRNTFFSLKYWRFIHNCECELRYLQWQWCFRLFSFPEFEEGSNSYITPRSCNRQGSPKYRMNIIFLRCDIAI